MYEIRSTDDIAGVDESGTSSENEDDIGNQLVIDFVDDFLSDYHDKFLDFLLNELVQDAIHESYENHLLDIIADEADDRMDYQIMSHINR